MSKNTSLVTVKKFQTDLPVGKSFWDFKIFKQILIKSVPAILTSMLLAFLPLVDNIFAGILGDNAVAAISYVVSLQFLFLVINIGMQGATGVILAQYFGRKDYVGVRSAHKFKVLIGLGNGIVAFAIFYPLANQLLHLYTRDFGIINMGTIYLRITLFSLFFYWVNDAWASSLSQVGQTRVALLVVVFSVAANAILDWTFVAPLNMGISGLAWSTVLVNIMATIIYFFYAWKTKSVVFFNLLTVFKINLTVIKKTLKRWHMVLIEVSFSFGLLFVNILIARSYDDYNGVTFGVINGMVGIFFRILFASIGGFYAAVALFCGRYLGANLFEEAYVNAKRIYFSSFVLGVLLSALIAGFATFYVNIFFPNVTEPNKAQAIMVLRLYPMMLPAFVVGILSFSDPRIRRTK